MFSFSVCLWIKSNASPGVGTPFSYAVPGQANELVLIEWGNNPMEILINDKVTGKLIVMAKARWSIFYLCRASVEFTVCAKLGQNYWMVCSDESVYPDNFFVLGMDMR